MASLPLTFVALAALPSTSVLGTLPAQAGTDGTVGPPSDLTGCQTETWYGATRTGNNTYEGIGSTVGKHNGGSKEAELTLQTATTEEKSTTYEGSAEISASYAIATVKASYKIGITSKTTKGVTVTDKLLVPAGWNGYITPKVQVTTFSIYRYRTLANCKDTETYLGSVDAITAYPFFSECVVESGSCAPKP